MKEWSSVLTVSVTLFQRVFASLQYKSFEHVLGKGEIARNEQFLLFPHCVLPIWIIFCHFHQIQNCRLQTLPVSSLPNNTFLDWSKLKAFADDKMNVPRNFKFVLARVANIVGKRENAGYKHFLLFPQCFQKLLFF